MSRNPITGSAERHPAALRNAVNYETGPNPSGLCMCGCGAATTIAKWTQSSKGTVGGFPRQYVPGHNNRKTRAVDYVVDGKSGCWHWQGSIGPEGYGNVVKCPRTGRLRGPHVIAFETKGGPVSDGHHVDHRCHNADLSCPGGPCVHRRCVNPDHLRAVAPRVNVLAGRGMGARAAARTSCANGHDYTPENLFMKDAGGGRLKRGCRICQEAWNLRSAMRAKERRARAGIK
jgi:hypothetical protein